MSKLNCEFVSKFLEDNRNFAKQWFLDHVDKEELESWIADKEAINFSKVPSGAPRNSLTSSLFKELVEGRKTKRDNLGAERKISRAKFEGLSEREVFLELIRDISNELDVNVLCYKILLNVSLLTNSDRGSLFLARGTREGRYLVSKLFDVSETTTLEESLHTEENEIRVPFGKGIAGTVALTKKPINIRNAYEDSRFNKEVDKKTGYRTQSLLCMPILNYHGDLLGVAQIMNKIDGSTEFTTQDERIFENYLGFCGIGLTNAQLFEMSVHEYQRNQLLLQLARNIFEEQTNLDKLVQKIMSDAQSMLNCARCNVFIIEEMIEQDQDAFMKHHLAVRDLNTPKDEPKLQSPEDVFFSKAFELHAESKGSIICPGTNDLQKSPNADIAKEVAISGESLNVQDTLSDQRFGKEMVSYDGFKIRNLLSVPIRDSKRKTIGIIQTMNKLTGKPFNDNDANILEAFAIFCGLGIHNCQMYENACKLMAKQNVALEVLSYHASASMEETEKIKNSKILTGKEYQLYTFEFDDLHLSDDDTVRATIRMFLDCGVVNKFHVPYEVLCRWTLSVKKNYRPVTYHNWRHAFNVAQTMFTMIYTGKMKKYMSDEEVFGLIVACLCHDLDHRGTNNAFQSKVEHPLAQLYSTSTMEHHHFDQCIMILNSEGNNIFQHLSAKEYRDVIKIIEGAILSTDLALYFKKKGQFQELVETGEKTWNDAPKKELLRGMMMTACDVSAITKPWEVQQRVAHLVAGEFFEQGDIERSQLNLEPMAMMDRKKKDELPKMQIGFIDGICMPVYTMLYKLERNLQPLYDGVTFNRGQWQNMADNFQYDNESDTKNGPVPPQDNASQKGKPAGQVVANKLGCSAGKSNKMKFSGPFIKRNSPKVYRKNGKVESSDATVSHTHSNASLRSQKSRTCTLL